MLGLVLVFCVGFVFAALEHVKKSGATDPGPLPTFVLMMAGFYIIATIAYRVEAHGSKNFLMELLQAIEVK